MGLEKWVDSPERWMAKGKWTYADLAERVSGGLDGDRCILGLRFRARNIADRGELNTWVRDALPPESMPAALRDAEAMLRTAPRDEGRSKHDLRVRVYIPLPDDLDVWLHVEISGSFRAVWGVVPDVHDVLVQVAAAGYSVQVSNPWAR